MYFTQFKEWSKKFCNLDEEFILQKVVQFSSNFDDFWIRFLVNIFLNGCLLTKNSDSLKNWDV